MKLISRNKREFAKKLSAKTQWFVLFTSIILLISCQDEKVLSAFEYSSNLPCFRVEKLERNLLHSKIQVEAFLIDTTAGDTSVWLMGDLTEQDQELCECDSSDLRIFIRVMARSDTRFDHTFSSNSCQ